MTGNRSYGKDYDELYSNAQYFNYKRWMFAPYKSAIFRKFGVERNSLVLDVGCGTGFFSDILQSSQGMKVVGLDYSQVGIRAAFNNFGGSQIEFLVGDANALPFESGIFDLIFCRSLSTYNVDDLSTQTEFSKRLLRILKKGGLFIFAWSTDGSGIRNSPRRRLISKQDNNWINHTVVDIRQHFYSLNSFGSAHFYFVNRLDLLLFGKYGLNRVFSKLNGILSALSGIRGEAICIMRKSF